MKKTLCYIILLTMVIHCASRLGVLSHLYKNRHHIAQAIGFVVEIPIAICSSDYYADQLVFHSDGDQSDVAIPTFAHAFEINLFLQVDHVVLGARDVLPVDHQSHLVNLFPSPPCARIFHPPSLS